MSKRFPLRNIAVILLAIVSLLLWPLSPLRAAPAMAATPSLSSLQKQKQQLEQQKQQAAADQKQKEQQATDLQQQLSLLSGQMTKTQNALNATKDSITSTEATLADTKTKITDATTQLTTAQDLLSNLLVEEYMSDHNQFLRAMITEPTISSFYAKVKDMEAFQDQLKSLAEKVQTLRSGLESDKKDQEASLAKLDTLSQQQTLQRQGLASQQNTKNQLLNNTTATISQLKQAQTAADAQIQAIQSKMNTLIATRSWGGQIVSSNDASWYYSQLDYPNVTLGGSRYSVALYGCLITSMAMVATYFGHHTTPPDIANQDWLFTSEGYLAVASPPGLGVSITGSSAVNWDVIDTELQAGRPVIVSLYLPSVGAINSDGSSHFVVIKDKSGSTYLMQDPLGAGRGYSLSQVRSMRLVRPS